MLLLTGSYAVSYLLQLDTLPEVKGNTKQKVLSSQDKLFRDLQGKGIKVKRLNSITYLTNIVQVEMSLSQMDQIKMSSGVKQVIENVIYAMPDPIHSGSAGTLTTNTTADYTGVFESRRKYGISGKNIKIGIVDTGIDYTHSAFQNDQGISCLGKGCRVRYGYDFTGENAPNDCMDNNLHGTHVSGITAGNNDIITGVAPNAILGGYKVFARGGGATNFNILQALSQAAKDGMQIINLSLGSPSGWDHGVLEEAIHELHLLDIIVLAAAGNNGLDSLSLIGSPAISEDAIAVASMNAMFVARLGSFSYQNTNFDFQFRTSPNGLMSSKISFVGNACNYSDPINSINTTQHLYVLVDSSGCSLRQKFQNLKSHPVVPVVILSNDNYMNEGLLPDSTALYISLSNGNLLKSKISEDDVLLISDAPFTTIPLPLNTTDVSNSPYNAPSYFSSWGFGPQLEIKPDVAAPGHLIYSSFPKSKCNGQDCYAVLSGTSMSTPYLSGCAALYLEYFKSLSNINGVAQVFKKLVKTTARPSYDATMMYSVAQQGAGMVNMMGILEHLQHYNSDKGVLSIEPSSIQLGAGTRFNTKYLILKNLGNKSFDVRIQSNNAYSVASTEQGTFSFHASHHKLLSTQYLTIPPKSTKVLDIQISVDPTLNSTQHWLFSGYIKINQYSIPYGGFYGDYQSLPLFTTDAKLGFPYVKVNKQIYNNGKEFTTTFNSSMVDMPIVHVRFVNPVEAMQISLFTDKGKAVGILVYQKNVRKNLAKNPTQYMSRFAFLTQFEDGTYCVGCVAVDKELKNWKEIENGRYYFTIIAQKALGDVHNKDHYETWTSSLFTVKRETNRKLKTKEIKKYIDMEGLQINK